MSRRTARHTTTGSATALVLGVPLITSDDRLRSLPGVRSLW